MKRFWAAIVLLAAILGACTVSAMVVEGFAQKTIGYLEEAKERAEEKNYSAANIRCKDAQKLWTSKSGMLESLLRHSEADQVETGLAKLVSYSQTADHDEFLALCEEVIHNIRHVRSMELPLLRNIL